MCAVFLRQGERLFHFVKYPRRFACDYPKTTSWKTAFLLSPEALKEKPDAAVICVPAHLHMTMATQLVQAGIPVLIEKPLSVSLDEAEAFRATT